MKKIIILFLSVSLTSNFSFSCCYERDYEIFPLGIKDNNIVAFVIDCQRYDSIPFGNVCSWEGTFSLSFIFNDTIYSYKNILVFKDLADSLYENLKEEKYQVAIQIVKKYTNFTIAELTYMEYFYGLDTCQIIQNSNIEDVEYEGKYDFHKYFLSKITFTYNNDNYYFESNDDNLFMIENMIKSIRIYKIKNFEIIVFATGKEYEKYGKQDYNIENCVQELIFGAMHNYIYNFVTWKGKT
jgi:hypothetical protein